MSVRGAGDDAARTHITLLHTPQFHRPTHVRCRVTNVSRIRRSRDGSRPTAPGPRTFRRFRSGPDTPRPSPAPRPDTRVRPPRPRSGRRGRATARSSVASETSCARGRTGRGPARPAVGREGPALGRRRKGNRISYCYGPLTTAIFTRNSYDITHRRSCGASTYEIRVPAAARTAPHKRKQVASAARHENFSNFVGKPARRACVEKYAQVDHSVLS